MTNLSRDSTDMPDSKIGTTVWSRYARVGNDCRSTLGLLLGASEASFSLMIIFWRKNVCLRMGLLTLSLRQRNQNMMEIKLEKHSLALNTK